MRVEEENKNKWNFVETFHLFIATVKKKKDSSFRKKKEMISSVDEIQSKK
jgi:hypothetical protein